MVHARPFLHFFTENHAITIGAYGRPPVSSGVNSDLLRVAAAAAVAVAVGDPDGGRHGGRHAVASGAHKELIGVGGARVPPRRLQRP